MDVSRSCYVYDFCAQPLRKRDDWTQNAKNQSGAKDWYSLKKKIIAYINGNLECEVTFEKHYTSSRNHPWYGCGTCGWWKGQASFGPCNSPKVQLKFTISSSRLPPSFPPQSHHFSPSHNLSQAALLPLKYLTEHSHHLPSKAKEKWVELSLDVAQQSCSLRWRKTENISSWACGLSSSSKCHLFCSNSWIKISQITNITSFSWLFTEMSLRNQNHQALTFNPLLFYSSHNVFRLPETQIWLSRPCYHPFWVSMLRGIDPEEDCDLQYEHILLRSWCK